MIRTPRGHFTILAQRCRKAAKRKDMAGLQGYLASASFVEALAAQEGELVRRIAVRIMTEALAQCASPERPPGAQPRRMTRWTEERIAILRKALFRGGRAAARSALGVSDTAVRLAAKRHVPDWVAPTTPWSRKAA